jgi:hypothetical protein
MARTVAELPPGARIPEYYYWDRGGVGSSRYQGIFVFIDVAVVIAEA